MVSRSAVPQPAHHDDPHPHPHPTCPIEIGGWMRRGSGCAAWLGRWSAGLSSPTAGKLGGGVFCLCAGCVPWGQTGWARFTVEGIGLWGSCCANSYYGRRGLCAQNGSNRYRGCIFKHARSRLSTQCPQNGGRPYATQIYHHAMHARPPSANTGRSFSANRDGWNLFGCVPRGCWMTARCDRLSPLSLRA